MCLLVKFMAGGLSAERCAVAVGEFVKKYSNAPEVIFVLFLSLSGIPQHQYTYLDGYYGTSSVNTDQYMLQL